MIVNRSLRSFYRKELSSTCYSITKKNNELENSVVLFHHIPYVGEHSSFHLLHVSELFLSVLIYRGNLINLIFYCSNLNFRHLHQQSIKELDNTWEAAKSFNDHHKMKSWIIHYDVGYFIIFVTDHFIINT